MSVRTRCIYIAGPMRGLPELNFPAFHEAADRFRRDGWTVRNPVEIGREVFGPSPDAVSPSEFLRADLRVLVECDTIAVLPGWAGSVGASCEVAMAIALGFDVYDAITGREIRRPDQVLVRGYSAPAWMDVSPGPNAAPAGSHTEGRV